MFIKTLKIPPLFPPSKSLPSPSPCVAVETQLSDQLSVHISDRLSEPSYISPSFIAGLNTTKPAMEYENYFTNELKPVPSSEKSSPYFDCSICLDFAKDPVVTLCGHLYCWPCIYKWLSFQTTSTDSDHKTPLCPVCKSEISHTSVVPLYGRGGKPFSDDDAATKTAVIPPRPHPTFVTPSIPAQQLSYRNNENYRQPPYGSYNNRLPDFYGYNPNVYMYGEMIYARVFGGNSQSLYTFPNSYYLAGSSNPRLRRQEMEVHRSLNRLTIFLFCCFFLCLLLF